MPVIDITKIPAVKIPAPLERSVKVILAPDTQDEVKDISITMGIIAPHSSNDLHNHDGVELLYIVTGYGQVILGDESFEIKPDTLIIAPPGVMRQQINNSDETMKMFCVWTPPVLGKNVIARAVNSVKGSN